MLRSEHGDVSLIVSQKPCPVCGAPIVQLREPKPALSIQIVSAVRDADLTPDDLSELADALGRAATNASPRELAALVPAASKVITIASKAGENWIGLLALIVAVIAIYIAHTDAQQAHQDAERAIESAHTDAERARQDSQDALKQARSADRKTSTLSDDEVRKIAEQIEAELRRRPASH